jgi:Protein of unknown function (DUF3313)
MKPSIPLRPFAVLIGLCAGLTMGYPTGVSAADAPAQVSKDGLVLKTDTKQRLVYVRPGATFNQYDRVMILDCFVQFQQGWQQNYNANVGPDLSRQVTNEDVARIKSALAAEFKRVFTAELQKGGYPVTTSPAPDVLLLRPAIVDLQVTAPDIMGSAWDVNVITSAGSGTLYLELWNPSTDTILARVMDAQADQQPFAQRANSVTNQQAADIILTKWADQFVRHLDAVRGKPAGK